MSGKKTKLKAGCGVVALFGLGYVFGVVSLFILISVIVPLSQGWKSEASKKFIADHLANQLKMTEEQREELRPLVNEFLDRRWELRRDYLKGSLTVMEQEYLPRIDGLLTEEQRVEVRKIFDRWRKENQAMIDEPAER